MAEPEYIEREALKRDLIDNRSFYPVIVKHAIEDAPAADVAPVVHGEWVLEVHDEGVNYRWHVTAECSECCNEKKEIWAGFFPDVPDHIAKFISLQEAERVKLSNYCPNCGAKMDGGKHGET